jgi:predicted exporter
MRAGGIALGLMAAIAGFIWIAQRLNLAFAPRSFMTSDRTWVLIGVVALVGGVAFARWSWRRS